MLGLRNYGQKRDKRQGVNPPDGARYRRARGDKEGGKIGDHQHKDKQRDEARFPREVFAEPLGPHKKPAYEQARNTDRTGDGEKSGEIEIEAAGTLGVEKG